MEKNKLLSLMRFWLLGTFLIVLVATSVYVELFTHQSLLVSIESSFPVWGITALLCIVWYYIYKLYLRRKY
jgi:hypothetical protein